VGLRATIRPVLAVSGCFDAFSERPGGSGGSPPAIHVNRPAQAESRQQSPDPSLAVSAAPFPSSAKPTAPRRWEGSGVRQTLAAVMLAVLAVPLTAHAAVATAADQATGDRYATARREMGVHLYPAYRVLERLMQANRIATPMAISLRSPNLKDCQATTVQSAPCPSDTALPGDLPKDATLAWAVQLIAASNVLASSQALTNGGFLLRIDKAIIDRLALKPTQLSCVIAQELAHATLDHPRRFRTRSHELDVKTATLINSAVRNANKAQLNRDAWLSFAMGLSTVGSGLSAASGNLAQANQALIQNRLTSLTLRAAAKAGGQAYQSYITAYYPILSTNAPRSLAAIAGMDGLDIHFWNRTHKDIDLYLKNYRQQIAALQLQLQLEADARSIEYVARAGINPQACLEAIFPDAVSEALAGATTSTTTSTTSSATSQRRYAMQAAINFLPENLLPQNLRKGEPSSSVTYSPMAYGLDLNSNTVSVFPAGTLPPRRTAEDKFRPVEGLLGR